MRRRRTSCLVVLLCLGSLLVLAAPVRAAGPFDGIWFVNQLCGGSGSLGLFVASVTENDATAMFFGTTFNIVFFVLNPTSGTWTVDFGTRNGSTVQGQIFAPSGLSLGTFAVTATDPTTFSGSANIQGISCSLSGSKVF